MAKSQRPVVMDKLSSSDLHDLPWMGIKGPKLQQIFLTLFTKYGILCDLLSFEVTKFRILYHITNEQYN
jgi:hypothetical protein